MSGAEPDDEEYEEFEEMLEHAQTAQVGNGYQLSYSLILLIFLCLNDETFLKMSNLFAFSILLVVYMFRNSLLYYN